MIRGDWPLVAGREIRQRTRSKAFVISSLFLMAVVVAGVVLSAVLRDDGRDRMRVVLVERAATATAPASAQVQALLRPIGASIERDVRTTEVATRQLADDALRSGDADVVVDGTVAVWRRTVDDVELAVVQAAIQAAVREQRAAALGLSDAQLQALLEPVSVRTETLQPRAADQGVRTGTAAAGLVLLFLAIQIHGAAVLMGVVEEKSSHVVEVILGHVRPRSLLAGKIVGIGVVGLAQVALVAGAALGALFAVRSVDAPKVPAGAIVWFVVWFVLGFALYATVFASLGSLVSRQEDAQSVVTPATIPLLLSYFVGFAAVDDPGSTIARVTSIIPLSAPMVMPVRLAAATPPAWEIALSLALVLAGIAGVLLLGGRLYERNVLRSGSTSSLRRVVRSLRAPT